jgi:hypothetical protein
MGCRRNRPPDEDSTQPVALPSRLSSAHQIKSAYQTASLPNDPDDPAIWVHPAVGYIVCTDQLEGASEYHIVWRTVRWSR